MWTGGGESKTRFFVDVINEWPLRVPLAAKQQTGVALLSRCIRTWPVNGTGVDLAKILGGQIKLLGRKGGEKSEKCMGDSQLLGVHARAAPKTTPMVNGPPT